MSKGWIRGKHSPSTVLAPREPPIQQDATIRILRYPVQGLGGFPWPEDLPAGQNPGVCPGLGIRRRDKPRDEGICRFQCRAVDCPCKTELTDVFPVMVLRAVSVSKASTRTWPVHTANPLVLGPAARAQCTREEFRKAESMGLTRSSRVLE